MILIKFPAPKSNLIQAKWYQDTPAPSGVWKWQGADDASAWTDIGLSFTLGGAPQTQIELSGNAVGYRHYRLLGVSGSKSLTPWLQEIEFKQCTC